MTLQLGDALLRAVYLFMDGGALLVILASFLCIGAGGRFGGLFVLFSGTFLVLLIVYARYCLMYYSFRDLSFLGRLIVCLCRTLLVSLSAWNLVLSLFVFPGGFCSKELLLPQCSNLPFPYVSPHWEDQWTCFLKKPSVDSQHWLTTRKPAKHHGLHSSFLFLLFLISFLFSCFFFVF